ncbi:MAG TPA: YicC family protein [Methylophilus sp.]|nr:YicC family protein [Methylophilus sp.]HQQ32290.1 YicC family protein [Methylophilus sp.]
MTGFASQQHATNNGTLVLELRAVNHRYLELSFRMDEAMRNFEPMLREQIAARVGRGKVDCRLTFSPASILTSAPNLDHDVLQQLAETISKVARHFEHTQPVNVLDVLRIPGVMTVPTLDEEALESDLKALLDGALDDLIAARLREGEKLKAIILARLAEVEAQVQIVKPLMPNLIKQYQTKLTDKLREACQAQDEERIQQEMVLFAQRIDVDEELSRLDAHISEVKRILSAGKAAGKRLDFLMQEMNREANTLGSKSVSIETTQVSMQLKVLIEQMREQIQNIE